MTNHFEIQCEIMSKITTLCIDNGFTNWEAKSKLNDLVYEMAYSKQIELLEDLGRDIELKKEIRQEMSKGVK